MRILSGIQPSGKSHLGNYFSMMRRMIAYQEENQLFCFIASYHSLTTISSKEDLCSHTLDMATDFLALGMDADKSVFWLQSDVPQVTELAWILAQHITVPQLELAHSYKDKLAQNISPTGGLFLYPILMAADVLAFGGEKIPVGKDQKQHIEMCRSIARRFNQTYGETFIVPEADVMDEVETVPGVDGRKMSKSYGNAIYPFTSEKQIRKAVMSIVTDSKGVDEVKEVSASVLYDIYSLFLTKKEQKELVNRFQTPGTGYGHIKKDLLEKILDYFSDARTRRERLVGEPEKIREILYSGAIKARKVAEVFLSKARENVGLSWN